LFQEYKIHDAARNIIGLELHLGMTTELPQVQVRLPLAALQHPYQKGMLICPHVNNNMKMQIPDYGG
jgi:hypothetical protein